ncbi:MAG: alpha-amylase family glycosyl hydrolase, partial [Saprospiraceae bacterium]
DWDLPELKAIFSRWHQAMGESGWVTLFLDNHDFPRMISRFADDGDYREESAKLLATLLLTLRGTPCIYQGSEIGMTNIKMEKLEDFDDVEIKNYVAEMRERGEDPEMMIPIFNKMGRDNARTPIQWSAAKNAGFTSGEPWLKINPNYTDINAEAALADKDSIFYYYQKMIQLRKQHPTLIYGDYEDLAPDSDELFIYRRWDEAHEYLIFLNFSYEYISLFNLQNIPAEALLICNYNSNGFGHTPELAAWEARVYQLK